MTPPLREPREYPRKLILRETTVIGPLMAWFYLHSNFRGGLGKTRVLCNGVRRGCSRSSKVIDFSPNRKRVYNMDVKTGLSQKYGIEFRHLRWKGITKFWEFLGGRKVKQVDSREDWHWASTLPKYTDKKTDVMDSGLQETDILDKDIIVGPSCRR